MRAEFIATPDITPDHLTQWRDLASRAVEPNPFHEPEYLLPLARHLGAEHGVAVLAVSDDSGWQACLPVRLGRWHRYPVPAISTWRAHPLYSLLGNPLVGGSDPREALATLLAAAVPPRAVAIAALEWVSCDGEVGRLLEELLDSRAVPAGRYERFERAALRRRPVNDYVESSLSSKHRRELRRQRRKLGEQLGDEPTMVDRAGSDAAPDDFIALEAAGKKSVSGTPLAADDEHVRFFKEMCRGFAAQGRLQLFSLQAGGQTVASKCNIVAGNTVFCLKIAFDERWANLSPGIQLELDTIKYFHEESIAETMDSCAYAGNPMINRLWPDRRALATYVVPSGGLVGRGVLPAMNAARKIKDRIDTGGASDETS